MRLYVGNLSYEATERDLREAFEKFGEVAGVIVIEDRLTGRSKGFGFVEMPSDEEARQAIAGLNGREIRERVILVNRASANTFRPPM